MAALSGEAVAAAMQPLPLGLGAASEKRPSEEQRLQWLDIGAKTCWLDRLPGILVGAFFRRRNEARFKRDLHGEVHTFSEEHDLKVHFLRPNRELSGVGSPRAECAGNEAMEPVRRRTACVIFLAGGGYLAGGPVQFYPYFQVLSKEFGVAVAGCEYRSLLTHPRHKIPFDAEADVQRCVKHLHDNADALGLDSSRFVLAGASSGGHLASISALRNHGLGLAGLVLFNPVLDLTFADGWAHRPFMIRVVGSILQQAYGIAKLREHSPLHNVRQLPYPTLIMHGTTDTLVPISEAKAFQEKLQQTKSQCALVEFPDGKHKFFNYRVSKKNFSRCVDIIGDFLQAAGLLDKAHRE